jgi:benzoyl-CoA reductase/2-hydroxyglutaryl-CoA dehydratase subunit BcrC/BadD/HgdB
MTDDYNVIWKELGIDLERHDKLIGGLGVIYPKIYLSQQNRPKAMAYFDDFVIDLHGFRVRELYEHKKKGGRIIGTFCLYVPDEIVMTLGAIPVSLCGGTDFTIPDAEAILPINLCPLIKSFYGFKAGRLSPYFQVSDIIVGETTCDGKKKVYEVLSDLGPVYVLEIPHKKNEDSAKLWRIEIDKFVKMVEKMTGNKLTYEDLKEFTKIFNEKRRALQRLNALRWNSPPPISGKDALLVNQVAWFDEPVRFTKAVNELSDELEGRVKKGEGVFPEQQLRLMTSGTPYAIPNWKIHHIVESSGYPIVAEESCVGSRYYTELADETPDTIDGLIGALADRYLKINCACFTPNEERMDSIVDLYKKSKAKGLINYTLSFCTPYLVEANRVEMRAKKEGLPVLNIESDYSRGDNEQIKTRIQAFIESI